MYTLYPFYLLTLKMIVDISNFYTIFCPILYLCLLFRDILPFFFLIFLNNFYLLGNCIIPNCFYKGTVVLIVWRIGYVFRFRQFQHKI